MPISPQTAAWLEQRGYAYHCFISWPLNVGRYMTDFAQKLKEELIEQLGLQIYEPSVYLNTDDTPAGANWPQDMKLKLCRSLSMVALCAPIYFDPHHHWTGLEWAAMEKLGHDRLADPTVKTIIPIKVSELGALPVVVAETAWIDVANERLRGRSFLNSRAFRDKVAEIIRRIEDIADRVQANDVPPGCDAFAFPEENAFGDYHREVQGLPLTGGGA